MSSDFAFSETTPLRQTEYNNAISSTTAITLPNSLSSSGGISSNGGGGGGNGTNNINNNNNNSINNSNSIHNNINNRSNNNSITTTPTGATIQVETGLNSNYNGINNRILHRNTTIGGATNNNNNGSNNRVKGLKMDTHRKIVRKIAFDFAILLCGKESWKICARKTFSKITLTLILYLIPNLTIGVPILMFFLFVEPYKRGFFCDDESLKHPFHDSTVKNYMLYIIGLLVPFCIILLMEYLHGKNRSAPKYRFMDSDISSWIVESYKQVGIFAFGAGSQQLVVDIAKYSVGRLRPHFIDVCQPIMPDGTRCDNPLNIGRYIEDFTCEAQNSTPRMIKDMRLSFPSGHASFSAFTMVYCIIYLQSRMNWRGSKLVKHFIQLLLFSITWFTSLSRISDYKHHWSDVLAGASIGIIFAIIVSQCVADFNSKNFELPRTQNDITATNLNITTTNHQQFTNYQQQNHQNSSNGHNNNHS